MKLFRVRVTLVTIEPIRVYKDVITVKANKGKENNHETQEDEIFEQLTRVYV